MQINVKVNANVIENEFLRMKNKLETNKQTNKKGSKKVENKLKTFRFEMLI